jgi:DNA-binding HxlR family transcriptional regulator
MSRHTKTPAELRLRPVTGLSQSLGGKYQLRILWLLHLRPARYGEIRNALVRGTLGQPVTPRVLSRELKDLQARGLIDREALHTVPPQVTYSLTARGLELVPILQGMVDPGLTGANEEIPGVKSEDSAAAASTGAAISK